MAYGIAGIDVHKKKLAVVVAEVEVHEEYQFERRRYGLQPHRRRALSHVPGIASSGRQHHQPNSLPPCVAWPTKPPTPVC